MVAYSFQKRFAALIESGLKTQTIRAHRKRHARPGEAIQLYAGMRTRHCRKLLAPDPICRMVAPVALDVPGPGQNVLIRDADGNWTRIGDGFAVADGFADAADFSDFWRDTHGVGPFDGVLISWAAPRGGSGQHQPGIDPEVIEDE